MKRYKVVGAVAALAVSTIGLAGCSNSPSGTSGSSTKVLRIAGLAAGDHAGIQAVADLFTKQTGVKVTITEDGSPNYPTTLRTQLGAGTAPDVFFTFPGGGSPASEQTLGKAGLLADLSSESFVSKIPPAYKSATQVDGKTYLAPQTQGLIGAIYNQTALDKAGLTAPTTFPEVLQFCAAAKAKGKAAYSLGLNDNFVTQFIPYALTPTLVYGPNPKFAAEQAAGTASFGKSGWQETFKEYVQMKDAGCFQKNFLGTSFNDSLTLVSKGEAFGNVVVNAVLPQLREGAPSGTEFKMTAFPATDNADQTVLAASLAGGYAVNAKAKNMANAKKFIQLLTSPEGETLYATKAAGLPALLDSTFKPDSALDDVLPFLKSNKFTSYPDQGWPNAKVQQTHFTAVQQLLSGQASVAEALQQMDAAYKGN